MNTEDQEFRPSSVNDVGIGIEAHDDELKKLSEYFEKSRAEIQKKVDSLLTFEIPIKIVEPKEKNAVNPLKPVDAGAKSKQEKEASLNFLPIDLETASVLRELTIGNCVHSFSADWKRAKFVFRTEEDLSYGLFSEKNGSKGFILAVQTVILKNLILGAYKDIHGNEVKDSEWRNQRKILKPTEVEKKEVLIKSLADILWQAGEKKFACVVENSNRNCFELPTSNAMNNNSNNSRKACYYGDGFTERLHLIQFSKYKSLDEYLRKNIGTFQKENGCLLFLYSLILSRKLDQIVEDLQGSLLLTDMEDAKISLFNLVMSAFATPYLHNGQLFYDPDGRYLEKPIIGLKDRSDIGILYWNSQDEDIKRTQVGSMLRTPRYPIWLCMFGKNSLAILFCTNMDLTNNWRLEQFFQMYFYSGLKKQDKEHRIEIDNRNIQDSVPDPVKVFKQKHPNIFMQDEDKEPEIITIIQTKWPECEIHNIDAKELMSLV